MSAAYREQAPSPGLRDVVRCIWTFEDVAPDPEPQRIAPDGCAELIVHIETPYAETGGAPQPRVLFAGQITAPLTLSARGRTSVLAVRFEPHGARAFLGMSMAKATDRRIDLATLHGDTAAMFSVAVKAAPDRDTRIALAESYLVARMGHAPRIDALVRDGVERLARGETVDAGACCERARQRRFADQVGVSPRMLASIFRFRRVFDAIEQPGASGWVEAALTAGYFDQPQMARDFRRFLGCTASDWARRQTGLARALAASETYKC